MATWPDTLPAYLQSGATEGVAATSLHSKAGPVYGAPNATQVTRTNYRSINGELILSVAQKNTLQTFYRTDLAGGSLPFDADLAHTGSIRGYRFIKPLRFRPIGDRWIIEMELGVMP